MRDDGRGQARRAPYWRVWRLTCYLRANWQTLHGRALQRGVHLDALSAVDLLDLAWAAFTDDIVLPLSTQAVHRSSIVASVADAFDESPILAERWGVSKRDIAAAEAMYELAGGPAPLVDRSGSTDGG